MCGKSHYPVVGKYRSHQYHEEWVQVIDSVGAIDASIDLYICVVFIFKEIWSN